MMRSQFLRGAKSAACPKTLLCTLDCSFLAKSFKKMKTPGGGTAPSPRWVKPKFCRAGTLLGPERKRVVPALPRRQRELISTPRIRARRAREDEVAVGICPDLDPASFLCIDRGLMRNDEFVVDALSDLNRPIVHTASPVAGEFVAPLDEVDSRA